MLGGSGFVSQDLTAVRGSSYWNSSKLLDNVSVYGYNKRFVARKCNRTSQRTSEMSHSMTAVSDFGPQIP